MKVFNLIGILCLFAFSSLAQQDKLSFDRKNHDFGTIKEDGGKVSTRFAFKNNKTAALEITKVVVSCGCTSPEWPKEAIAPGDTGSILITFDPMDRPGHFDKTIGVEIDGFPSTILMIKGEVSPRPEGPRDWYPFFLGNLWFQHSNMFIGGVYNDTTVTFSNVVYNPTDAPISIDWAGVKLPGSFLRIEADAKEVAAGDSVHFRMVYNTGERQDWGYVIDDIFLPTGDTEEPEKKLTAGAIIKERFDMSQPQPKIAVNRKEHVFGSIPYNSEHTTEFTVTNEGEGVLFVRKIGSNCPCISATFPPEGIAPGASATIQVTLTTGEHMGWVRKMATIVTNDPAMSFKNVIIKADVQPPKGN